MTSSLRHQLLRRLLPGVLTTLLAGAATAYWVALRSATLAYDRSLLNTALAVAEQIRVIEGNPQLQLTAQATAVLFADKFDRVYYAVRNEKGRLLSGENIALPQSLNEMQELEESGRAYYDTELDNKTHLRIAALKTRLNDQTLIVLAAETLNKRNAIVRDIILGMLLPEILLLLVTVILIGLGIRIALGPLSGMRAQLANRSHTDLSPLEAAVPDEMKPLIDELNSLFSRLEQSLASQRHFISNAAHQLRTPIAALQAHVEVALRENSQSGNQSLDKVLGATRRLSHLVDQLLALARTEPSHQLPFKRLDWCEIIRNNSERWLPQAIAKGIDLGFELIPAHITGNALLLGELLGNLVDNAIRHTPTGGTINLFCHTAGNNAIVAIEDSGEGIAPEEREKVLERFYQPANSRSDGCGLGLAIVNEIARQHQGRVEISASRLLGGACIVVTLPLSTADVCSS